MDIPKKTGVAVPLGALRTDDSPVVGEYTALPEFAAFARSAGLSVVQLLPVLDSGTHSSPYSSLSAFALHPLYINVSRVTGFDLVMESDHDFARTYGELMSHRDDERFDYRAVLSLKEELLRRIFRRIAHSSIPGIPDKCERFHAFISEMSAWLPEYCVFKTLKEEHAQAGWRSWRRQFRSMTVEQVQALWDDDSRRESTFFYAWEQMMAFRQFSEAAEEVRAMGVTLKGDLPILLNEDSCDVWSHPSLFCRGGMAGSPPDGDNPSGQTWGFPLYDWRAQAEDGYSWWKRRLSVAARFFGAYRLDHIPGFFRFWSIGTGERSADLGVSEPNSPITSSALAKAGFSRERIRWLSEPHIPTNDVFRLTGSLDRAHEILSLCCDRIGHEELWNFSRSVTGESDILSLDLGRFGLDAQIQREMAALLVRWWKDRTLIEVRRGSFVPSCKFRETRAWRSLSEREQAALFALFEQSWARQDEMQGAQARAIFSELIPSSGMVPCGEDLGALPAELPAVMDEFGILGLKVVRWCRRWGERDQPFEDLSRLRGRSVVVTSVHDSTTLRAWWNSDKPAVRAFVRDVLDGGGPVGADEMPLAERGFAPDIAERVLSACARNSGAWFVNPLQDWLALDAQFYPEPEEDGFPTGGGDQDKKIVQALESANGGPPAPVRRRRDDSYFDRVNVPGTVSDRNWTWRMPVPVSRLASNGSLCGKIRAVAEIHDGFVPPEQ